MALLLAGVTSLGLLMVSRANAGIKATRYVTINDNTKTASGSAGDARASANGVEYIGCYVSQAYSTGGADGVCHARNAAGVSRACHAAAEEHLIRAMRAVKSGSMVTFSWGDDGLCTYVEVINHSVLRPKTP